MGFTWHGQFYTVPFSFLNPSRSIRCNLHKTCYLTHFNGLITNPRYGLTNFAL